MAETHGPAGHDGQLHADGQPDGSGSFDHSTLEVVPSHEYDRAAFGKNDKIAYVPSRENDKVVVEQPYNSLYPEASHPGPYSPQTTLAQGGSAWDGDAWTTEADPGSGKREKILGLKRRTFFIVLWVVSILAAIGVGVGTGVGVSLSTSNNSSGAEADAAGSGGNMATHSTSSLPTQTSAGTTSSIPRPFTSISVSILPSAGAVQVGGSGGRCTSEYWGPNCICLDGNVCQNKWKGKTYSGNGPGHWPCPNDPNNIVACLVQPCLGKALPSQCLWREACSQVDNTTVSAPRCPGGDDFVCCDVPW